MFNFMKIRYFIVVALLLVFTWWGTKAFLRYWSQPLTTDISYSFGDNENGIQFPQVTFCPYKFFRENSFLKQCYSESSWTFIDTFHGCLKKDRVRK